MLKYWKIFFLILTTSCCYGDDSADRLDLEPTEYHLKFYVDFHNEIMKGELQINMASYTNETNLLKLDLDPSVEVDYKSIIFRQKERRAAFGSEDMAVVQKLRRLNVVMVDRTNFDRTTLQIHLDENFQLATNYQVFMRFHHNLTNSANRTSVYTRHTFENATQTERKLAIVDLTKKSCSSVFPCFDKTQIKVPFKVTVVCPSTHFAFSATPVEYIERTMNDQYKEYSFETTPPMAMNALAIIVAEDVEVFQINPSDEPIPTSHFRNFGYDRKYDLMTMKYLFQQCENQLIRFPLRMLTIVIVPSDVKINEINALGIIILNEKLFKACDHSILKDNEYQEDVSDDFYAVFNAMNFMQRINDQWLKFVATPLTINSTVDGLNRYLAVQSASKMMFTLKMDGWSNFVPFMKSDVLWTELYMITTAWDNQNESVRHDKNILLFNMLRTIYGEWLMKTALKNFLLKTTYSVYTDNDIWSYMNRIVGHHSVESTLSQENPPESIQQMINSWTSVDRIPLISVYVHRKVGEIAVNLEPHVHAYDRYDLKNATIAAETFHNKWFVPIEVVVLNDNVNASTILGAASPVKNINWVKLPNSILNKPIQPSEYILINPSVIGPYVVNYDLNNWKMLVKHFAEFPTNVSARLLMHAMSLAWIGRLDFEIVLDMAEQVSYSYDNFFSMELVANILFNDVRGMLHGPLLRKYDGYFASTLLSIGDKLAEIEDVSPRLRNYFRKQLVCSSVYSLCGLTKEYRNLRRQARSGANLTGSHTCLIAKKLAFYEWLDVAVPLLRDHIDNYVGYNRTKALRMVSCTRNENALDLLLRGIFFLQTLNITDDDRLTVISTISDTPEGCQALLSFTKKNFKDLKQRASNKTVNELLLRMTNFLNTDDEYKELVALYSENKGEFGEHEEHIKKSIEKLQMELDWYRFNYPKLERWIDNQNVTNPDVFGLNRHRIVESYLEFTDRRSAITTNTPTTTVNPFLATRRFPH